MRLVTRLCLGSTALVLGSAGLVSAAICLSEADRQDAELRDRYHTLAVLVASQVEAGYHEQLWPFELLTRVAKEPSFASWSIADGEGTGILSEPPVRTAGTPGVTPRDGAQGTRLVPSAGCEKTTEGSASRILRMTTSRGPSGGGDQPSGKSRTESNPAAPIK